MRKKRLFVLSLLLFIGLFAAYLIVRPAFRYLSGYLSKSEEVKANILVVEGWLPDFALDSAYEEFHKRDYQYIVTTGLKSSRDFYMLSGNGYLIFYPKKMFSGTDNTGRHSIEVETYSELGGENRAHFNLYINGKQEGEFYAERRKKKYGVTWEGNLRDIDSIMVQYDNDRRGYFGDRNLFVRSVTIDNKFTIPYLNNSEYHVLKPGRNQRIINNYSSNAELARNKLISLGLDSSQVIATRGNRTKINRTLTSAVAFSNWLNTTKIKVTGINIITLGPHARRTWMTYSKILKDKYQIGIISVPEPITKHTREIKILSTLRETLGIIYYWIILLPY
jgi:hypothetical protein